MGQGAADSQGDHRGRGARQASSGSSHAELERLVLRAKDGDLSATREVIERFHGFLVKLTVRWMTRCRIPSSHPIDEFINEAVFAVPLAARWFRADRERVSFPWLLERAVFHQLNEYWSQVRSPVSIPLSARRRLNGQAPFQQPEPVDARTMGEVDGEGEVDSDRQRMQRALSRLDERARHVLVRWAYDEVSPQELADEMGVSKETIRRWKNSGLKQLRTILLTV